jgi:hypothetical protein
MTDVRLLETLAARQQGCVARWQLVAGGWTGARCDHALRGLRRRHDGVYVTGHAPVTALQRWWAASLTAPRTVLGLDSAGCYWGLRDREGRAMTVVRPGRRGLERQPGLIVRYSATLDGNVARHRGLWVTTPERTVIDLWPRLHGRAPERLLRDAVRLQLVSTGGLMDVLDRHRGRRGAGTLRITCERYERLPLDRCRSDAEVEGLLVLDGARLPVPEVNVRRAGEEADFSWADRRLIVEIDGPAYHQDALEDARKTRIWTQAGWTVRRISSGDVYAHPDRLLTLVRSERRAVQPPNVGPTRP